MIRIRTASRLHFGLLALPAPGAPAWLNHDGQPAIPRRAFGGAGLMIERPGLELTVAKAPAWSAQGPLAQRALAFAQTCAAAIGTELAFHIEVVHAAPEHAGLGTGTQLGLAVARAIAELTEQPGRDAETLARLVGRGRRSALGVFGFERGGFLVEAGKAREASLAPLVGRWDFPADWQMLLVLPSGAVGVHGTTEMDAFARLSAHGTDDRVTDALSRLVMLGLIPALLEHDLRGFGESLYDYNRRVGEMFAPAQGGLYAHASSADIVQAVRERGIAGVGQSSWGPTVFIVVAKDQAEETAAWLAKKYPAAEVMRTEACNHGAGVRAD